MEKKICYFGFYNPSYSRNLINQQGLKENGFSFITCHSRARGLKKYFSVARQFWRQRKDISIIIVGFPSQLATIFARLLAGRKKIIISDPLVSLYDSLISDRRQHSRASWRARYYWLLDWLAFRCADKILIDTHAHQRYFSQEFKIGAQKFILNPVSSLAAPAATAPAAKKDFTIFFYGTYIPLQGVEYIMEAVKILLKTEKGLRFVFVGSKIKEKFASAFSSPQVEFFPNLPYAELVSQLAKADLSLGIFGKTAKAQRVVPNKIYDAMAVGVAAITADTPAIREIFTPEKDIFVVPAAAPRALAEKIKQARADGQKRKAIAQNAQNLFIRFYAPAQAVKDLVAYLQSYVR